MTSGLLGGAFDPPHLGHVALARTALDRFGLERLRVLVVAEPAHKPVGTAVEQRLELARLAFAGLPRTEVLVDRHAYTVETVADGGLVENDAVFLVGADEFASFLSWREPDRILEHVRLGVATRPGYPEERLEPVLAALERPDRVELFAIPAHDVSSTDVRARAARGEPLAGLVPPAVAHRIVELGLYHGGC
ncbi:MAG: nicotinate-nicotinamide nucleotide adenylyltransferase [Gaiellaceae bacterium]